MEFKFTCGIYFFTQARKIEKGLTQETIIIDKTVLTEADMHNLTSLIHEKERKNN